MIQNERFIAALDNGDSSAVTTIIGDIDDMMNEVLVCNVRRGGQD